MLFFLLSFSNNILIKIIENTNNMLFELGWFLLYINIFIISLNNS